MGLIKNLFKKKLSKNTQVQFTLPRPSPRIQLLPLHRITFSFAHPGSDHQLVEAANLSTTGIGFLKGDAQTWPSPGSTIEGVLEISQKKIPLQAKVIHHTHKVVGCQFLGDLTELHEQIRRYFELELCALKMDHLSPEELQPSVEERHQWFYGDNNCELFVTERDEKMIRFQLSFFGNFFEGGEDRNLTFGYVVDEKDLQQTADGTSVAVLPQQSFGSDLIASAIKFVSNIKALDPKQKTTICAALQTASAPTSL